MRDVMIFRVLWTLKSSSTGAPVDYLMLEFPKQPDASHKTHLAAVVAGSADVLKISVDFSKPIVSGLKKL